MKSLVLSLGHNASAVLVDDGNILAGYEEERLSGIKSDSVFPIRSINRLVELYPGNIDAICVGHWFLDGLLPADDFKHWRLDIIRRMFPKAEILSLRRGFSHHDSHLESAEAFVGEEFPSDHHVFVVDGFGTHGEVISIYHVKGDIRAKVFSAYGFNNSLGLLYQYATDFCGMKMHQHEYKMLAYEAHISELILDTSVIDEWIDEQSHAAINQLMIQKPEILLSDLMNCKEDIHKKLQDYLGFIQMNKLCEGVYTERNRRILVSYFAQRYVENVMRTICIVVNPTNLIVVGGLFLNVKVNSMLCDMIPGKFSAMPLAGDQGAGLGVYHRYFKDLKWPGHLFWGIRDKFTSSEITDIRLNGDIDDIKTQLYRHGIVNLIRGPMEFGPRTLCNTSTLAIPTMANTVKINTMNGRTTEMPFGLVVTDYHARNLFVDTDKVHQSLEYMILTRDFKPDRHLGYKGGAHHYPLQGRYTCRPQITYDPMMIELLDEFGPLINTSMNVHGQPIVWNQQQIEYAHLKEQETLPITTVIMED